MNRSQRRRLGNRRALLIGASLATSAAVGYVGYSRMLPAFAATSCEVTSNSPDPTSTASGTLAACLADGTVTEISFASDITRITLASSQDPFVIDRSLTIDGNSTIGGEATRVVIDGNNNKIFKATSGTLTLKGLVLENGYSLNRGGSIEAFDGSETSSPVDVVLDGVEISNSRTEFKGGGVYASGNVTLEKTGSFDNYIHNSTVDRDTSEGISAGGAIYAGGDVTINGKASFKNNRAEQLEARGGAIYADNLVVTADEVSFDNNRSQYGGGVFAYTDVRIEAKASFTNNYSQFSGGAIYAGNDANVVQSEFIGNKGAYGGAIATEDLTVVESTFSENNATSLGGAIHAYRSILKETVFENNSAYESGGAVFTYGSVYVNYSLFDSNSLDGEESRGGAIFSVNNTPFFVSNSTFYRNSATRAAAIFHGPVSPGTVNPATAESLQLDFVTIYKNYLPRTSRYSAAVEAAKANVYNSIIAGNFRDGSETGIDLAVGEVLNLGGVIFSSEQSTYAPNESPVSNATNPDDNVIFGSPRLSALADNGGFTKTLRPKFDSPALNAGQEPISVPSTPSVPADLKANLDFDQRGQDRFIDELVDIGAVEVQVPLAPEQFNITVSAGAGGSISPDGIQVVDELTSHTFVVTPDTGFEIEWVSIDGILQTITDNQSFSYTFADVEKNHVIAASFVSDGSEPAPEVEQDEPSQAPATGSQPAAPSPAATVISLETVDHKPGDVAVVETSNWNETAKILISGLEVEIVEVANNLVSFQVPELEPGTYPLVVQSDLATITVLVDFVVTESIASTAGEFKAWTKRISDDQVKVYVKNPINQGKVQVLVDGKEIAWLRAENETDPKLRQADGSYYLVRTVGLTPTKQAIEVLLDGNRVWRAVYTDKS